MTQINTITVEGVEYSLDSFSDSVKQLVAIRGEWATDLQKERLAAAKTEAALRALEVELTNAVNSAIAEGTVTVVGKPDAADVAKPKRAAKK